MGKSQNPVEAHRRKQRLKEIKKNKEKRINERDERVKETKTADDLKKEIKDVERRHKHQLSQHEVKSKLDRLKKELKLVEAHEEEKKKQEAENNKGPSNQYATEKKFIKLDRPEMSVYYDPQYNPYGAPPPGKPMLYHRYGGGVTMNIHEAIVPGEEPSFQSNIPPPPPPTQSSGPLDSLPPRPPPRRDQYRNQRKPPQGQQHRSQQPPQPPLPKEEPPPPPPPPKQKDPPPPPPPPIDKDVVPDLPPPSDAVKRSQKRKRNGLAADIWASSEEVAYEKAVHKVDLEDATAATSLCEEKDEWYYRDTSGNTQGPFKSEQMLGWYSMGYFPPQTPVKQTGKHSDFVALGTLGKHVFKASGQKKKKKSKTDKQQKHQEQEQSAIQDRIAALKNQTQTQQQPEESHSRAAEEKEEEDSVQARVAALHQANMTQKGEEQQVEGRSALNVEQPAQDEINTLDNTHEQEAENEEADAADTSVQDRIAALRQQATLPEDGQDQEVEEGSFLEQQQVTGATDDPPIVASYPAGAESQQIDANAQEEAAVGPSVELEDGSGDNLPSYPVPGPTDENEEEGYPAVAPYPSTNDYGDKYPVAGDYPVVDEYPVVDDYPVTDEYPVVDEYPVTDDYPVTDEYPVTDAYPGTYDDNQDVDVHEQDNAGTESSTTATAPPKKKFKADQALVSLLPSHLQKKQLGSKKAKK